jgi:7-carboxy-7-deazaguanine synthase
MGALMREYADLLNAAPTTLYPLAPQGVFATIQGEGVMLGVPMVFVRLAGCPVGCPECDTNYTVAERVSASEIMRRIVAVGSRVKWVWLTGGEPTIHDLPVLVTEIRRYGFRIALATSGINPVQRGFARIYPPGGVDFVSVSPHTAGPEWVQRRGDQLNVVPGLNGLKLADFKGLNLSGFSHKFVTPCWYNAADRMERVRECVEWVNAHPDWQLGIQAHKFWGLA